MAGTINLALAPGDAGYEADHVICALDLLSGLADGMGAGVEALATANAGDLHECLVASCSDPHSPGIRRSAFALVGDLAKAGPGSCCSPRHRLPPVGRYCLPRHRMSFNLSNESSK